MKIEYITIIAGFLTFFFSVWKYYDTKKRDQDLKEFENYHKLIKDLVQPDEKEKMYIDRQASIVYELRHFKRYYPLTLRTLKSLKKEWNITENTYPRLLEEVDIAVEFIENKIK